MNLVSNMRFILILFISYSLVQAILPVNIASAQAPNLTEYEISTSNAGPTHIIKNDSKLWIVLASLKQVIKTDLSGNIEKTFTLLNTPTALAADGQGDIWVTQRSANAIIKIPKAGEEDSDLLAVTLFDPNNGPNQIVLGNDGNMWVTLTDASKIAKITSSGNVTTYDTITASSQPFGITNGPSGSIWFTEFAANKIGKIGSDGSVTEYSITTNSSGPTDIIEGADNNLWFTQFNTNKIGKITTAGTISEYAIPMAGANSSEIRSIIQGPLGTPLWFTLSNDNKIGQITPAGTIKALTTLTTAASGPYDLVVGSDGNIWITQNTAAGNSVTRAEPTDIVEFSTSTTLPAGESTVTYSQILAGTGGTAPYKFEVLAGDSLPDGILLSNDGTLSGAPSRIGDYQFRIKITDSEGVYNISQFSLKIGYRDLPDLSVALSGVRYSAKNGLRGKATPINIGTQSSGSFIYKFYLSKDTRLNANDKAIKTVSNPGIAAAGKKGSAVKVSYKKKITKYNYILVCVDPGDSIVEQEEDNNCDYRVITQ